MKWKICLLAFLWPYLGVFAQTAKPQTTLEAVQVGDKIPDEAWSLPLSVVNHPAGNRTIALNNYKDKLLILDFWATWCGPCVTSLEKLNTLQAQFKDRLYVLPVTYQESTVVTSFMSKKQWKLPSVTSDSVLSHFFPHVSVPHQVWIMDGSVIAIVGPEYATAANIDEVLKGEKVRMHMKNELLDFDASKPLLINGNGGDGSNLLYQSIITHRINTRSSGASRRPDRVAIYNADLISLYREAFSYRIPYAGRRNRIILHVNDSLRRLILSPEAELVGDFEKDLPLIRWLKKNTYCYSLTFPVNVPPKKMYAIMQNDLNRFFAAYLGVQGRVEKQKVKCLVLIRTASDDLLSTKGGSPLLKTNTGAFRLQNKPFRLLVANLINANWRSPYPIIDATGYEGNIDIELSGPLSDLGQVKKELAMYGLDLVERERWIDMLIISTI